MESISGEQLKEDVTALLRRCTGDPSLRAPVRVVRSKWVTDPLYLGAYSYGAIDSEFPQNQVRLQIIPHKRSNSLTFPLFFFSLNPFLILVRIHAKYSSNFDKFSGKKGKSETILA